MGAIETLLKRIGTLEDGIVELLRRDQDTQRRMANILRPGKVAEVSDDGKMVRVEWSKDENGEPVKTGWIPFATRSGKIKIWQPASVGEQVMLCSPCGEMGSNSWAMQGGFSNANPANHNKDGEYMISIGGTSFHLTKDGLTIKAKSMKVESGKVEYEKKPPQDPGEPAPAPAPARPSVPTADVPMS